MDGRFGSVALGVAAVFAVALPGCGRSIDFDADTPLSCTQDADCPASLVCDGDTCVDPGGADATTASDDGASGSNDDASSDDGATSSDDGATTTGDDGGTSTGPGGLDLGDGDGDGDGDGGSQCGNGIIEPSEQCDGANLNGIDCEGLGYAFGELGCDAVTCTYDVTNCLVSGGGTTGA